ncbi:hypothetical protein MMC28_008836 [Mycoblastus sanguinarius]|nr:hypothetical protein [Mycoblastus sanguinarius]
MAPIKQDVVLDTTLQELYSLEEADDQNIVLVYAVPTADVQMTSAISLSTKFVYQSPLATTTDSDELARLFLQVVPQLFGFIAGKMPLVLYDLQRDEVADLNDFYPDPFMRAHQNDAFRVFEQLSPSQQPELSFVAKPEDIVLPPRAKIAVVNPMDCMLHLPHLVDPESHYEVLSKSSLALSGLPTPKSEVIETELQPYQAHDEPLMKSELARMIASISERQVPFVIKVPQALSGQGTFLVRTEPDRKNALRTLEVELSKMLRQLNEFNVHMRPCSLVLQEMIPGEAVALSIFVTKSGKAVLTSCCPQIVDPTGHWGGGFISYKQQSHLQQLYAGTVDKLANYLHQKGYQGPIGADVMIDGQGRQLIIDLNVRVTGSHPLGFLKTHFSVERNLHEAVLFFPLFLKCTRDTFDEVFEQELRDGSLVVNGWCHNRHGKSSIISITLAAEDSEKLREFIARVNLYKVSE